MYFDSYEEHIYAMNNHNVVLLAAPEVQDEEFIYPYYRIQEEFDIGLFVCSVTEETVYGKYGIPMKPNISLDKILGIIEKIDAVIIPGGWGPEKMRMDLRVLTLVKSLHKDNKILSAVCHGPQVLISAEVLKGKNVTGYKGIRDDLENCGASYQDKNLVVDGNIITAPHYRNNPEWMRATIKAIHELPKRKNN